MKEEIETKKGNKCWSCGGFRAYYTRGYCCLLKEKNGFCLKQQKVVQRNDSCDIWNCRHVEKKDRVDIVLRTMPEIYHKIATIEQILKDEMQAEQQ